MALKQATPDVAVEDTPEMDGQTQFAAIDVDAEFTDDAETAEAAPSAESTTPTSRRSKAEEQGQRPPAPAPARNLDDDENFRKWKSESDRKYAEAERRRQQAEQALQAQQAQLAAIQAQQMQAQLTAQLNDENLEPQQRVQLVNQMADQMASQRALGMAQGWRQWEQHVKSEVAAAGLDVDAFNPFAYEGEEGRLAFERDLAAQKAVRLERERDALKEAASPASISRLVQEAVAKILQAQGLNQVDTGQGATPAAADSWERDKELLRQGRLKPGDLAKKYGRT
jgi:hypothetical protein